MYIVFSEQKAIYLGITKCASVAIRHSFKKTDRQLIRPETRASKIRSKYPDYRIFTFVRNPYNRVVRGSEKLVHIEPWLKPQTWYIDTEIDYIGRLENLSDDFEYITNKLKIDHSLLEKKHSTPNKLHYSAYYWPQIEKLITEMFETDLKEYNYKFERKCECIVNEKKRKKDFTALINSYNHLKKKLPEYDKIIKRYR